MSCDGPRYGHMEEQRIVALISEYNKKEAFLPSAMNDWIDRRIKAKHVKPPARDSGWRAWMSALAVLSQRRQAEGQVKGNHY